MSNKLKRALVSQGSISRMLQAAEQALRRKDFQQNLELLERARSLDPANPAILLQLGRSHGLRFNYAAAEECFEKAIQLSDRKSKTQIMAVAVLQSRDFLNPELTERYSRRAAEQKDATAGTLVHLAELYERLRRLDEAAKLIDRALQMDRDLPAGSARARPAGAPGRPFGRSGEAAAGPSPQGRPGNAGRANYQLGADPRSRKGDMMKRCPPSSRPRRPFSEWRGRSLSNVSCSARTIRENAGPHFRRNFAALV